jgi:hypothetical protein
MLSTRATWTLCAVSLVLVVITVAHLHPSSGFTLPVLPSGRLFEPVYVHDLFQPENRLLNTTQCINAYPELYYEADRARRWYTTRSGITEKMVDAAEKDGGNARLTIINNQVRYHSNNFTKSFAHRSALCQALRRRHQHPNASNACYSLFYRHYKSGAHAGC